VPAIALSVGGRVAQSRAFFAIGAMPQLYSGMPTSSASAERRASHHCCTIVGGSCSTSGFTHGNRSTQSRISTSSSGGATRRARRTRPELVEAARRLPLKAMAR
jgi:hypothetical protein